MFETLRHSGGINALAHILGEPPATTLAGAEALLPGLLAGFRGFAGGLDALLAMLDDLGGGNLAAAVMGHEAVDTAPGVAILARLPRYETEDGAIDPALRDRILPLLAMLAGGYFAARATGSGLPPGELAQLLEPDRKTLSDDEAV